MAAPALAERTYGNVGQRTKWAGSTTFSNGALHNPRADAVQSLALPMDFRFQSDRFGWRVEAGESQPEVARVAAEALQLLPHEALGALPLRRVHDVRGGEVPRRADEQVRPAALEQRLRRRW